MVEAERLKAEGLFAMIFFGSTAYGGDGASRAVWTINTSFGGTYYDDEGNMLQSHTAFNTPFYQQSAIAINGSSCKPWQGTLERPNEAAELIMNILPFD